MNKSKTRSRLFVSLFLIIISAYPLHAADSGTFTGTVRDTVSGEPLAYARVMIPGSIHFAKADKHGRFSIDGIPEGDYYVQCVYPGYKSYQSEILTIRSGQKTQLSIYLSEISIDCNHLTPDEERPLDQSVDENRIFVLKSSDFQNWPVHDYQSIVNIRAGYTLYTPSRNLTQQKDNLYFRGGQTYHSAVFIDETADRNAFTGNAEIVINKNAIDEIITLTGNGNAEYGAYQSGVIQVRTKNPADRYSGHVEYINDFAAPAFFSYSYGYQNGSFGFGGPVVPGYDKIKFYVSAEGQIFDDAEPSVFGFPKYIADSTGHYGNRYYSYDLDYSNIKDWSRDTVKISGWDPANGIYNTQYKKGARPKTMNGDGCNSLKYGNLYGKLIYDVNDKMKVTFHSAYGQTIRRIFTPEKTFNIDHVTRLEKKYKSMGGTVSYQINDNSMFDFGGHLYSSRTREMDDRFGWNINWSLMNIGTISKPDYKNMGIFESPGRGNTTFSQNEISAVSLKSSYVRQISNNQFKAGIDYSFHTIRMMDIYELVNDPVYGMNNLIGYRIDYTMPTPTRPNGHLHIKNQNNDYYDRDTRRGRQPLDGARHPYSAGLYIQDRYSHKDYSLWAGLGCYIFNSDANRIKDPYNPLGTPGVDTVFQIGPEDFKKPKTFFRISPRAGVSVKLSDEIILRSNAGIYVQQPPFNKMYVSAKTLETMVTQPPIANVIGNPNIKPEKSFQWEIGIYGNIQKFIIIDFSAYYKRFYNPVGIKMINANINAGYWRYLSYANLGSGNIYGLTLTGEHKRKNKIQNQLWINFQIAKDHNMSPNGKLRPAWEPYVISYFYTHSDYDQRFRISHIINIRNGSKEGLKVGKFYVIENSGINIYHIFSTGFPYTPTQPVAVTVENTEGRVVLGRNSKRRPHYYRIDLKADKTFSLSNSVSLQVYVLVLNVLNRKNPIDVYTSSGNAHDDGYRSTAQGQASIMERGPEYNEQYNIRMKNGLFYDTPRQVRLGLLLNF